MRPNPTMRRHRLRCLFPVTISIVAAFGCAQLRLPEPPDTDAGSGVDPDGSTDGAVGNDGQVDGALTDGGTDGPNIPLGCTELTADGPLIVPVAVTGPKPFDGGTTSVAPGSYEVTEQKYYKRRDIPGYPDGPVTSVPVTATSWHMLADGGMALSNRNEQGLGSARSGLWYQQTDAGFTTFEREFLCPVKEPPYGLFTATETDGGYLVCTAAEPSEDFYGLCEIWRRKN